MQKTIKNWNKNNPTGTKVTYNPVQKKKKCEGKTMSLAFVSDRYPEPSVYVEGIIGAVPISQLELVNDNH